VLYDSAPPGSINLGLGEPDFPTPEVVRREAIRVIQEEQISYTTNAGIQPMRQRIAEYHSDGLPVPYAAESVCVTTGAEEALFAVMMAIVGPGDQALLPDPGYIAYPAIAEIAGADRRYFATPSAGGFAFDRDTFDRAVTGKTRLVVINSPSNPTSRVISRDDMRFIADRLSGSGAWVLADEIYRDLYVGEYPATISEFYENTIIVQVFKDDEYDRLAAWLGGRASGSDSPRDRDAPVHVDLHIGGDSKGRACRVHRRGAP
jgi:aspartate/methionine/tyrosine aminotransferase